MRSLQNHASTESLRLRRLAVALVRCALLFAVIVGSARTILVVLPMLLTAREAGFGDAYVLYDAGHFRQTGVMYRPAHEQPYTPSVYGPMHYEMLAWSMPWSRNGAPIGPRVMELAIFLLCALVAASIARKLTRSWWAAGLTIALLVSCELFGPWIVQLRADFAAILVGLVSVRLVMSRHSSARVLGAGCLAGLAPLLKLTYLSVPAAVFLWFCWRRRFREAAVYSVGFLLVLLVGFGYFIKTQPEFVRHVTVLLKPLIHNLGVFTLLLQLASNPLFFVGCAGCIWFVSRNRGRWALLVTAALISMVLGAYTARQAGANVNYFFECLFLMAPAAAGLTVYAVRRCQEIPPACLVAAALLLAAAVSMLVSVKEQGPRIQNALSGVQDQQFVRFRNEFSDRVVFSAIPLMAAAGRNVPPMSDPILLHYMEILGSFDPTPLIHRIQAGEFDNVIVNNYSASFRGYGWLSSSITSAILGSYTPVCHHGDILVMQPNTRPDPAFRAKLAEDGCETQGLAPFGHRLAFASLK